MLADERAADERGNNAEVGHHRLVVDAEAEPENGLTDGEYGDGPAERERWTALTAQR